MKYKGSFNNATTYPTGTIFKGDVYLLLNNSTIGNKIVTTGSYLMALVDTPGTTNSNWTVVTNYVAEDISNRNIANGYAGLDSNNAHIIKAINDKNILLTNTSTLTSDRILNLTIPDSTTSLTLAGNATISNINTGDETLSSITTKVGNASTTLPGLLTSSDWNTFNNKVSTTRTINTKPLNADIVLTSSDVLAVPLTRTINTLPLSSNIVLGASDVLAVPLTRTINTKALSSNIVLIPSDLGAESSSNKNVANGYAGLDATSKILMSQIPIGNASTTLSGLLTSSDWNTFNNKVSTTRTINTKALSSDITLIPSDLGAESSSNKNVANGYAGLDATSKILVSQMPITGLLYKGTWNASTNTPTLPGSPVTGDYYKVSVAGTTSISSINTWRVNDWIIYNGTSWDRVVNSESVTSVNSKTGTVVITASDVGLGNVNNTAISNLDSLTDVVVSGPTSSQVLQYNGSNWVNSVLPVSSSTLDGLTDVVVSGPVINNMLLYNGSNWVNNIFPSMDRWNEIALWSSSSQRSNGGIEGFGNISSNNYQNNIFNIRGLITPNYGGNNSIIGINTPGYIGRTATLRFVVGFGGTNSSGQNSTSILVNNIVVSTVSTYVSYINSYTVHDLVLNLNNIGGVSTIQATVNFGVSNPIDFYYYGMIVN